MSKALQEAFASNTAVNPSATLFSSMVGNFPMTSFGGAESQWQVTNRTAGVFSMLHTNISDNTIPATSTARFRKNTANGNQAASITASTTGWFTDSSNSDSVISADLLTFSVTGGAGGTSLTFKAYGCIWKATVGTTSKFATGNVNPPSASTRYKFLATPEVNNGLATESLTQLEIKSYSTFKNLNCYSASNGTSTASTVTLRKNSSNGTLTISAPAATSGHFEDTTHTDDVAPGDLVNYVDVQGTYAVFGFSPATYIDISSSNGEFYFMTCGINEVENANTTGIYPLEGAISLGFQTESTLQTTAYFNFKSWGLSTYVQANTVTATSTLRFRINASNKSQTVSIPSSSTGQFKDTTHIDNVVSTDKLNYELACGATGTSIALYSIYSVARELKIKDTILSGGVIVFKR